MGRILAIDYGRKRCGVAVTDILKISANGLPTVRTCDLLEFVKSYCSSEEVELIIIGEPKQNDGSPSESMRYITPFISKLRQTLPSIPLKMVDERFTSTIAHREMIAAGFKKSDRQRKGLADEMSAVLILTQYLQDSQLNLT